jgi:hypothetical protein
MHIHRLLLPLLGAALIALPALAQPSQPTAPPTRTDAGDWVSQLPPDQWQTSNLEGLDVYSSNNGAMIGDISDWSSTAAAMSRQW